MEQRITIRLRDELLEFIDRHVDEGRPSRAAVISAMLDRERRRALAERDVALLLADADDDLDALARHAAQPPVGSD